MEIFEISDLGSEKEKWDNFVLDNHGEFLQSFEWGSFKEKMGDKIWRLGMKDADPIRSSVKSYSLESHSAKSPNGLAFSDSRSSLKTSNGAEAEIGQALIIKHRLIFNKKYFYCPRGPIFFSFLSRDKKKEAIREFLIEIKNQAKKEKAIFFRFEPNLLLGNLNLEEIFSSLKLDSQPKEPTQPKETLVLDLKIEAEELLKSMHPKTRYNIRLAEKHGVKVSASPVRKLQLMSSFSKKFYQELSSGLSNGVSNDLKTFLDLLKETAKRKKIRIYSDQYYFNLLKEFPKENIKLYFAHYKNKILAVGLFLFWKETAIYLFGGSTQENREVMAPYLLHWEVIKEAKQKSFFAYDFWGIDEKKWPGLTRFKLGFGGRRIIYPQSYDLVFNKFWYFLYRLGSKIKHLLVLAH